MIKPVLKLCHHCLCLQRCLQNFMQPCDRWSIDNSCSIHRARLGLLSLLLCNVTVLLAAIIGREITMSALREWAASCSQEAHQAVAVSSWGKWKTATQASTHIMSKPPCLVNTYMPCQDSHALSTRARSNYSPDTICSASKAEPAFCKRATTAAWTVVCVLVCNLRWCLLMVRCLQVVSYSCSLLNLVQTIVQDLQLQSIWLLAARRASVCAHHSVRR